MKRASVLLSLAAVLGLGWSVRGTDPPSWLCRALDRQPPAVTLVVQEMAPETVSVTVEVEDRCPIATVVVSADGVILDGATEAPFEFLLAVPQSPAEICAVATDAAGNSARDCAVVKQPANAYE